MVMLTNKKKYSTNRKTTITKDTNNNSEKQQIEEKKKQINTNNKHKLCNPKKRSWQPTTPCTPKYRNILREFLRESYENFLKMD